VSARRDSCPGGHTWLARGARVQGGLVLLALLGLLALLLVLGRDLRGRAAGLLARLLRLGGVQRRETLPLDARGLARVRVALRHRRQLFRAGHHDHRGLRDRQDGGLRTVGPARRRGVGASVQEIARLGREMGVARVPPLRVALAGGLARLGGARVDRGLEPLEHDHVVGERDAQRVGGATEDQLLRPGDEEQAARRDLADPTDADQEPELLVGGGRDQGLERRETLARLVDAGDLDREPGLHGGLRVRDGLAATLGRVDAGKALDHDYLRGSFPTRTDVFVRVLFVTRNLSRKRRRNIATIS
jgi:hypothetical protein